jgi:transposase
MEETQILKFHVGIDVSKSTLDVALGLISYDQKTKLIATHKFKNNLKEFTDFLNWVNRKVNSETPISYSMEATGVYYEKLAFFLNEKGLKIHILVPSQAKKYVQSLGIKTKTDKIDAQSLMRLGLERKLKVWVAPDPCFSKLRILTRERERLVVERTQLLNQKHAYNSGYHQSTKTLKRIDKHINIINKLIIEVETEIKQIISSNEKLNEKIKKTTTIPGLGYTTVVTVIAETHGFNLIENIRQLTSYAGYDVVLEDSGQKKSKGKISKKGNRHIRKALHLPAIASRRSNPQYKAFYERIYNKRNVKMVGCVALQRKLLSLIYVLWKKDEEFNSSLHSGNHESETSFGCCETTKKSSATLKRHTTLDSHSVKSIAV